MMDDRKGVSKLELDKFRRRLMIDRDDLDGELVRQSDFYFEVSERLAYAKALRDESRRARDNAAATIKSELREALASEKPSEAKLNSLLEEEPDYIAARTYHHECEETVALWEAMTEAVKSRGYMLRQLADLYVANYYSPSSAGESREAKRERTHDRHASSRHSGASEAVDRARDRSNERRGNRAERRSVRRD